MTAEERGKRILVVDDEDSIRNSLAKFLARKGCDISEASGGLEAIKRLEEDSIDLAVVDIKMQGMDGLELLARMKNYDPDLPVIIMTGYANVQNTVKALKSGASDFLCKPFEFEKLYNSIKRLFDIQLALDEDRSVLPYCDFRINAKIPASMDNITGIVHCFTKIIREMKLCKRTRFSGINIALYEAIINAIEYGVGGDESKTVHVSAEINYHQAKFTIRDEGAGFDKSLVEDPTTYENIYKMCGRGIFLMRQFMDSVTYNGPGNEVTMIIKRAE